MRVGIQGWGSEGDLRPLVALGARLRQAGHTVGLVLSPVDGIDWAPLCSRVDVELSVVPKEMPVTLDSICRSAKSPSPLKVSQQLVELAYNPYQDAMYEAGLVLCDNSDLVVGLFSTNCVKAACLKSSTPFVSLHYYPGLVPTRQRPPVGFPNWRPFHPISWKLFGLVADVAFRAPAARFFASKGLPRVRHAIPDILFSDLLNLHGTSPTLFPPPADYGDLHQVCGDFVMPDDAEPWEPSAALRGFMESGERPLLVSFGTMETLAPERARDLVVAAVREAKVRAIVQSRCRDEEGRDGDIYFMRWAPHRQLLPCCSAMMMHGGAGTIHAALRAGVPAVVVPFILEQRIWGGLLERAGSAGKPLSLWKATPGKVAAKIREATTSEPMRQRASQLAARVALEDGTGTAVRLLEALG